MRIAHVSTFPNMKCGIAFYAADLVAALEGDEAELYALHYGTNSTPNSLADANANSEDEIVALARRINASGCEVVSLQHEFGIWGGANGENLLPFLKTLTKPIVSTLHTTFAIGARPQVQYEILAALVMRSALSLALTPNSRATALDALRVPASRIAVVPHGVPAIPFVQPADQQNADHYKIASIGFYRPDKGFEATLRALQQLKAVGFCFEYNIVGAPQPQFAGQEEYLSELQALVRTLHLEKEVSLDIAFPSQAEQIELLQKSHIGVFAYQEPNQSSSGTIPLVIACGRPVVCTPFEFARAKQSEMPEAVYLATDFSEDALAKTFSDALTPTLFDARRAKRIYEHAIDWRWGKVARAYRQAFQFATVAS